MCILFTIHFATINTRLKVNHLWKIPKFTIHFATINTPNLSIKSFTIKLFTIHFATINTIVFFYYTVLTTNLQYTLLLLILN